MSTIKVNAIQNSSGVEVYTAKAWVNFNGVGTVAIRASGNVSSITDNGTGQYTINLTSAMADANYAWSGSARVSGILTANNSVTVDGSGTTAQTTTALAIWIKRATAPIDCDDVFVAIFR